MRSRFVLFLLLPLLAGLVAPALTSPASSATRPAWKVTAVAGDDLQLGSRLLIRGTVSPGARGKYVYVEARSPGSPVFQTRRAVMVRVGSKYAVSVKPTEPGVWRYRILKPRSDGRRAGYSPVQVVNVWRWRSLESMLVEPDEAANTELKGAFSFGGIDVASGYVQGPAGARFFRLRKQCSRVDVWAGGDLASTTNDPADVSVDGASGETMLFTQHLATATVRREDSAIRLILTSAQVRPVHYLRISYAGTVDGDRAAWGNPRAYCLF